MKLGRIGRQVRTLLIGPAPSDERRSGLWNERVRAASQLALRTNGEGRRAGQVAREAVRGAAGVLSAIGGEASGIARDAVLGVVQGTFGSSKTTTPMIRENRGGGDPRVDRNGHRTFGPRGRTRWRGPLRARSSSVWNRAKRSPRLRTARLKPSTESGVDVGSAAKAAIVGVITGVSATGGDVPQAARDTAKLLIDQVSGDAAHLAYVAQSVVEGALEVQNVDHVYTVRYVGRSAEGAIDSAYEVSEEVGEEVRRAIAVMLEAPRVHVGPATAPLVQDLAERIAIYHPQGPLAWRINALWRAGWALFRIGGIDLAASLAFFTLLSFFPLIALIILIFSAFADPVTIKTEVAHVFLFFFPASGGVLQRFYRSSV